MIAAKVVAALLFGLVAIVLAVAIAALATVLAGEPGAWDNIGVDDFAKFGTPPDRVGSCRGWPSA